jgi:hypothetical protein
MPLRNWSGFFETCTRAACWELLRVCGVHLQFTLHIYWSSLKLRFRVSCWRPSTEPICFWDRNPSHSIRSRTVLTFPEPRGRPASTYQQAQCARSRSPLSIYGESRVWGTRAIDLLEFGEDCLVRSTLALEEVNHDTVLEGHFCTLRRRSFSFDGSITILKNLLVLTFQQSIFKDGVMHTGTFSAQTGHWFIVEEISKRIYRTLWIFNRGNWFRLSFGQEHREKHMESFLFQLFTSWSYFESVYSIFW